MSNDNENTKSAHAVDQAAKLLEKSRAKRRKIIKLPKNRQKAKDLLEQFFNVKATEILILPGKDQGKDKDKDKPGQGGGNQPPVSTVYEVQYGMTVFRNSDGLEALKDLGTVLGYAYEEE